jgi:hypothetical protein
MSAFGKSVCADVWLEAGTASPVLSPQSMTEGWKHRRRAHRIASHRHLLYHPQTTALHSRQRHTHFSTEQHLWTQTRNHGHNSRNAYHIHRNATYCWSTTRRQPPHHLLPRTRTPQNTRHPSRIRHASMRRSSHHLRSPPFKCRLGLDHKHNLGQGTPCIG